MYRIVPLCRKAGSFSIRSAYCPTFVRTIPTSPATRVHLSMSEATCALKPEGGWSRYVAQCFEAPDHRIVSQYVCTSEFKR
jgi:hypothetical protein